MACYIAEEQARCPLWHGQQHSQPRTEAFAKCPEIFWRCFEGRLGMWDRTFQDPGSGRVGLGREGGGPVASARSRGE